MKALPKMKKVKRKVPRKIKSALDVQIAGSHYKNMVIQPVVFCQKNRLDFCEANIVKYICRYKDKGGIEDLKKVKHYLELLCTIEGYEL